MRTLRSIAVAAVLLGCSATADATPIAISTFDTGTDGWTVGHFFSTFGAGAPTFVTSGGNPGGFIRTNDLFDWNSYSAPASFLAALPFAYGGTLSLDERIRNSDGVVYPMVVISDGTLQLQFRTSPPAVGEDWTSFSIPLVASAGWEIANASGLAGMAATPEQLQAVLLHPLFLKLDADWHTERSGDILTDQVDLDNVILNAVPEPSSLLLLGSGVAVVYRLRRRKFYRS